jgi:hypothetical protein
MSIDLVPVDAEESAQPPETEPETAPAEPETVSAAPENTENVPPERTEAPQKRRGRPPGSKNKPKPEQEEKEESPSPKKKVVRIARVERLPEPKVSEAVPVGILLRQRMLDVQTRASEDRALRQAAYTEMLAKKMGVY